MNFKFLFFGWILFNLPAFSRRPTRLWYKVDSCGNKYDELNFPWVRGVGRGRHRLRDVSPPPKSRSSRTPRAELYTIWCCPKPLSRNKSPSDPSREVAEVSQGGGSMGQARRNFKRVRSDILPFKVGSFVPTVRSVLGGEQWRSQGGPEGKFIVTKTTSKQTNKKTFLRSKKKNK